MPSTGRTFSEREFYLAEFRGRSIGFAWPDDEAPSEAVLTSLLPDLLRELVANGTRVVLMSSRDDVLALARRLATERGRVAEEVTLASTEQTSTFASKPWALSLWRLLRLHGCAALRLPAEDFEPSCQRVAVALRLAKVVWIQSTPPVYRGSSARAVSGGALSYDSARSRPAASAPAPLGDSGSSRVSVVDLAHFGPLLGERAAEGNGVPAASDDLGLVARPDGKGLLEAIRSMIRGGVPSVNVCAAEDVAKELLTYAGAGIFFTRNRYAEVRPLALDDYDQANDLIARGEEDGYLLPRDAASRDRVLANGVGLFIEGRYLAGMGALLPYALPAEQADDAGATRFAIEIASLYALTRYAGEGVGSQIVRFAIEHAREEGFEYAFSCTTSDRVAEFFKRSGFRIVGGDEIPESKWEHYDAERRTRVRCLRFDCGPHAVPNPSNPRKPD
jgi:GNAT superfamily N-acetyltransferase